MCVQKRTTQREPSGSRLSLTIKSSKSRTFVPFPNGWKPAQRLNPKTHGRERTKRRRKKRRKRRKRKRRKRRKRKKRRRKPGDIVFNIVAGKIVAFSVATYIGYLDSSTNWFMAPMHYQELTKPIDLSDNSVQSELARLSPKGSESCFTSEGKGKQGYLFILSDGLKDYLLSLVLLNNIK